jgi:hypothetical protein
MVGGFGVVAGITLDSGTIYESYQILAAVQAGRKNRKA